MGAPSFVSADGCTVGRFVAMASPCEILIDSDDTIEAAALLRTAEGEARRIETKFSRYRDDNTVHRINNAAGRTIEVDEETAGLLDYADTCWQTSAGMFDITSGALRRVWTFDGGARVPDPAAIHAVLSRVGWQRVTWQRPRLTMPAGMEIDFGGIGKEYAVDRAVVELAKLTSWAFLVNFGGDLFASGARREGRPWSVGIEDPDQPGGAPRYRIDFDRAGIATSGDARRFVQVNGRRLGHILDPTTGWPIEGAPRSVTVMAGSCTEAGTLSTLAYLRGTGAEAFLKDLGVPYWIL
jgi:thiamine biosynthesis lipoprotein